MIKHFPQKARRQWASILINGSNLKTSSQNEMARSILAVTRRFVIEVEHNQTNLTGESSWWAESPASLLEEASNLLFVRSHIVTDPPFDFSDQVCLLPNDFSCTLIFFLNNLIRLINFSEGNDNLDQNSSFFKFMNLWNFKIHQPSSMKFK